MTSLPLPSAKKLGLVIDLDTCVARSIHHTMTFAVGIVCKVPNITFGVDMCSIPVYSDFVNNITPSQLSKALTVTTVSVKWSISSYLTIAGVDIHTVSAFNINISSVEVTFVITKLPSIALT